MGESLAGLGQGGRPAGSSGGSARTGPLLGDTGGAPVSSGVVNRLLTARDAEPGNR